MSYQIKDIQRSSESVENEVMLEFVKLNPYPSYSCIEKMISNYTNKRYSLIWLSEFSEYNYKLCKDIYENPTNEELIRQCGQKIYNKGGEQAMQAIFYILVNFSPSSFSENPAIKFYLRTIEFNWNGIGEWGC